MEITLSGHMTVLIDIGGVHFLTDPWFGPCNLFERILAPRLMPPFMGLDNIPPIDAMIVSHNHIDHFDATAIDLARRTGCTVIGSTKAVRRAIKNGIDNTIALKHGDEINFKGVSIHAVYAAHPLASDAIGFAVRKSGTIYFSGDTRFSQEIIDPLSGFHVDIALVQAACARYPFAGKDGMDLTDIMLFAEKVRPSWTIPLHLDCIGKWLDPGRGIRIRKENKEEVSEALRDWTGVMKSKSLGAKILEPGKPWQPVKDSNVR